MTTSSFRIVRSAASAALLALAALPSPARAVSRAPGNPGVDITVLSGRADLVTAGDALVRFDVPDGIAMDSVAITRNGEDITRRLHRDDPSRTFIGIVDGLQLGENHLFAEWSGSGKSRPRRQLTLTDHPREGPVFSGKYQEPFFCEADKYLVPVLNVKAATGAALDDDRAWGTPAAPCSITTPDGSGRRVDYFYKSTTGKFVAWPPPPGAQIATTTTTRGATVPFIVRLETGTANRGIYYSMMLHDPSDAPPDFLHRSASWNGRLVYLIGDSCNGGWFRQGSTWVGQGPNDQPSPAMDILLGLGYALASSTLNDTSTDCNPVISAETLMATKERFVEVYGPPDHTVGFGVSGGATTQHSIADNYPGLLDGIVPGESFPDHLFSVENMWHDARLLTLFFAARAPPSCGEPPLAPCWTDAQKGAVTGFDGNATLTAPNMLSNFRNLEPDQFCPPYPLPPGTRCDIFAAFANQLGDDPETNTVRRPTDNVGIQYGLGKLRSSPGPGEISAAQFVDLNEHIGGLDADGHASPDRTHGDLGAIEAAYRSGLVTNGGLGLATTPIIDYRAYTDDFPPGDVHLRYYSFSMRARLLKANGHAGNQVMLLEDAGPKRNIYSVVLSGLLRSAFARMDQWLDEIAADGSRDPPWKKVVAARDRIGLHEGCRTTRGTPKLLVDDFREEAMSEVSKTPGDCADLYPVHSFPRGVAGESIATDLVKCALKPIDWADYPVTFTAEEQQRLLAAFPEGVCDYTKPGVGQQPPAGTWQRY